MDRVTIFCSDPLWSPRKTLVAVSHIVCTHVGDLKSSGTLCPGPLGWGRTAPDPLETHSYPRVILSKLVTVGQTYGCNYGVPKTSEDAAARPLGWGHVSRNMILLCHSRSNVRAYLWRSARKIYLASRLSKSLKVIIHAEHVVHRRGYCFHFGCMFVCLYVC